MKNVRSIYTFEIMPTRSGLIYQKDPLQKDDCFDHPCASIDEFITILHRIIPLANQEDASAVSELYKFIVVNKRLLETPLLHELSDILYKQLQTLIDTYPAKYPNHIRKELIQYKHIWNEGACV